MKREHLNGNDRFILFSTSYYASLIHSNIMSVYIQPADIANEQQMVTPIEKVLKDGDNIVLGNNIKHIMGSVSAAADASDFENKLNFFDLPFHPLSLHNSRDKSNGGLKELQLQPKLEPLKMLSSQSNFIATTMNELRESECAAATKRRKIEHRSVEQQVTLLASESEHDDDEDICDAVCADAYDDDSIGCSISSSRYDIQDELKANPHAIQIVASSGGLITHCKFCAHHIITLLNSRVWFVAKDFV